jgi:GMP synthase (glutamine-hydrolysing)
MSRVLVLQHHPAESLGLIEQALTLYGLTATYVRAWDGDMVPKRMRGYEGLVVLGGPMSVYEQAQYPWMIDEMRLIDRAVKADVPVLGICLGSQLLAAVLGAQVRRGAQPEIGWHEVRLAPLAAADAVWATIASDHESFQAFHWHGDIFDLPTGAEQLASSAITPCQGFVYGRSAYGTLFHLEVTEKVVADMLATFADEVRAAGLDGDALIAETNRRLIDLHHVGRPVFEAWAGLVLQARTD